MNFYKLNIATILFVLIAILTPVSTFAGSNWDEVASKRKADYIFMEANFYNSEESEYKYHDLISYAYKLNPSDLTIGFEKGVSDFSYISTNDSIEAEESYALLERYVKAYPQNLEQSMIFGRATNILKPQKSIAVWHDIDSVFPHDNIVKLYYAQALANGDTTQMFEAIDIYNKVEASEGKNPNYSEYKIQIYARLNDSTNILNEINNLLISDSTNAEFSMYAGLSHLSYLGDTIQALKYFDKACEIDSALNEAFYSRLLFYDQVTKDSISYNNEVFNIINNDNLSYELKHIVAKDYISKYLDNKDMHSKIGELLSILVEKNPNKIEGLDLYAAFLIEKEDYNMAVPYLTHALELDLTNETRWAQYILMTSSANNFNLTNNAIIEASERFPKSTSILEAAGIAYNSLKEYDKSIEYFKILELQTTNSDSLSNIYCSIADAYVEKSDMYNAFAYYEKSLDHNSYNSTTLNNYAYYIAINEGDISKADSLSTLATSIDPENAYNLDTYAWIKFLQIDYVTARKFIDWALEESSKPSAELLHHAGDIYFMCREIQKALDFWEAALKLEPENELLKKKVLHKTFFFK